MKLGFGLVTTQRHPDDPRSAGEVYRDAVELSVLAERVGFESVWLSEHHFIDDGYLPRTMVLAGAIAARTERIRIGTAVLLAPLHDPLALAEEAAVVDLLSSGRLTLGLGTGWRAGEFNGFGVPQEALGERLSEIIRVLREAWGPGPIETPNGTVVDVTPKPERPGGPPVLIGAAKRGGLRRIARDADGLIAARVSPRVLAEHVGVIGEELEVVGRSLDDVEIALHLPVLAAPDGTAWDTVKESWSYVDHAYAVMAGRSSSYRTVRGSEPTDGQSAQAVGAREAGLFGTPEQVAEQILRYRDALPVPLTFIARLYWPGLDAGVQREAMSVFMEGVAPLLGD
jgi:alkanesulfonate monooxygenase SsuD/methylene tetrahydromethanopterin reductase-like flavin-dependent oxidoreductase (luciferase family)